MMKKLLVFGLVMTFIGAGCLSATLMNLGRSRKIVANAFTYSGTGTAGSKENPHIIGDLTTLNGTNASTQFRGHVAANVGSVTPIYYKLGADIDLSSITNWTPIPRLGPNMVLDGSDSESDRNFEIQNLRNTGTGAAQGFIQNLQGTIKNVTFVNAQLIGNGNLRGVVAATVDRTSNTSNGTVGETINARIENVHVESGIVTGTRAGGLVGAVGITAANTNGSQTVVTHQDIEITPSESEASIDPVAARSVNLTIIRSSNSASVVREAAAIGPMQGVGGLLGYVFRSRVDIMISSNHGNVRNATVGSDPSTAGGVGGLIGLVTSPSSSNVVIPKATASGAVVNITASYNTGTISFAQVDTTVIPVLDADENVVSVDYAGSTSPSQGAGGLIGYVQANHSDKIIINIYASYNLGLVQLVASNNTNGRGIGGLVGVVEGAVLNISHSFNAGDIRAVTDVVGTMMLIGGLVGRVMQSTAVIENCFNTGLIYGNSPPGFSVLGAGIVAETVGSGSGNNSASVKITGSANTGAFDGILARQLLTQWGLAAPHTSNTVTNSYSSTGLDTGGGGAINAALAISRVNELGEIIDDIIKTILYGKFFITPPEDNGEFTFFSLNTAGAVYGGESYQFTITPTSGFAGAIPILTVLDDENNLYTNVTSSGPDGYGTFSYTIYDILTDKSIFVEPLQVAQHVVTLPRTGLGFTTTAPDGYSISGENFLNTFNHGATYTFTLAVAESHRNARPTVSAGGRTVTITPAGIAEDGIYTVSFIVAAPVTVVINCTPNTYTVTPPTGEGFTFQRTSPVGSNQVQWGNNYEFSVVPLPHYEIKSVTFQPTAGGTSSAAPLIGTNAYRITVTTSISIFVDAELVKYTVTLPTERIASGDPFEVTAPSTSIAYGSMFTFTLKLASSHNQTIPTVRYGQGAVAGTVVTNWTPVTGQTGEYTATFVVSGNMWVVVDNDYQTNTYTIAPPVGNGIGFDYAPDASHGSTATHGQPFTFTINLQAGYTQSPVVVKIDGIPLSAQPDGITYIVPGANVTKAFVITVEGVDLNKYTITYLPGATGAESQQTDTKIHGTNLTLRNAIFTRTGYTQTGWATTDGGVQVYALGAVYTANAPATLYPVWTLKTYTVTYMPGANGTGLQQTDTKNHFTPLTLRGLGTFTRIGHTLSGWATSDGGAQVYALGAAYATEANATLYPVWTIHASTLVVNPNGGVYDGETLVVRNFGSTYVVPVPTRDGYNFTGWVRSGSDNGTWNAGTRTFTFGADNNTTTTLTAGWQLRTYSIEYFSSTPSPSFGDVSGSQPAGVKTHGVTFQLAGVVFTTPGYVQVGWTTTAGGAQTHALGANYTVNAPLILYPVWNRLQNTAAIDTSVFGNANPYGSIAFSSAPTSASIMVQYGADVFIDIYPNTASPGYAVYEIELSYDNGINWDSISFYSASTVSSYRISSITSDTLIRARFAQRVGAAFDVKLGTATNTNNTYTGTGYILSATSLLAPVGGNYSFTITFTDGYSRFVLNSSNLASIVKVTGTGVLTVNGSAPTYTVTVSGYTGDFVVSVNTAPLTLNQYTVTYLPGANGTGVQQTDAKTHGTNLTLRNLGTFTRTGHTLSGWATSDGGPRAFVLGATYTTEADATLFPVWTIHVSTLTMNPSGGLYNGATSNTTVTQNYNTTYTVLAPTREGYTFTGWTRSGSTNGTWNNPTFTFGADNSTATTLTAGWTINTSTLVINPNSGVYNSLTSNTTITQNYNTTYIVLVPTREGYTFDGWARSGSANGTWNSGTRTFTFGAENATTTTLTAGWTINTSTLVINPNGGTYDNLTTNTTITQSFGTTYTVLTPLRNGHTFVGWTRSGSANGIWNNPTFTFGTETGTTTTLAATWDVHTYTVTFAAGSLTNPTFSGITGGTANKIKTFGVALQLPGAVFITTGWEQIGWTMTSGGAQTHALGANYTVDAPQTFYPVWKRNQYAVVFKDVNGTVTSTGTGYSVQGAGLVSHGADYTFTVTTVAPYTMYSPIATVSGGIVAANEGRVLNTWTFKISGTSVTASLTITVSASIDTFEVTMGSALEVTNRHSITLPSSWSPVVARPGVYAAPRGTHTFSVETLGNYTRLEPTVTIEGVRIYGTRTVGTNIWTYSATVNSAITIVVAANVDSFEVIRPDGSIVLGYFTNSDDPNMMDNGATYTFTVTLEATHSQLEAIVKTNGVRLTNGQQSGNVWTYSFLVLANTEITVQPQPNIYRLTSTGNGTASVEVEETGAIGVYTLRITITPDAHHIVSSFVINGSSIPYANGGTHILNDVSTFREINVVFVRPTRSITFRPNGGAGDTAVHVISGLRGAVVPNNTNTWNLTRTGYVLLGWDENPGAITPLIGVGASDFTIGAEDTTLYAIWGLTAYTIEVAKAIDLNGYEINITPVFPDGQGSIFRLGQNFVISIPEGASLPSPDIVWQVGDGSTFVALGLLGTSINLRDLITPEILDGIYDAVGTRITTLTFRPMFITTSMIMAQISNNGTVTVGVGIAETVLRGNASAEVPNNEQITLILTPSKHYEVGSATINGRSIINLDIGQNTNFFGEGVHLNVISRTVNSSSGVLVLVVDMFPMNIGLIVNFEAIEYSVIINAVESDGTPIGSILYQTMFITIEQGYNQLVMWDAIQNHGYSFDDYAIVDKADRAYIEWGGVFGQFSDGFMWVRMIENFPEQLMHNRSIIINARYNAEHTIKLELIGSQPSDIEVFVAYSAGTENIYFENPWDINSTAAASDIRIEIFAPAHYEPVLTVIGGEDGLIVINDEIKGVYIFSLLRDAVIEVEFVFKSVDLVQETLGRDGTTLTRTELGSWEISNVTPQFIGADAGTVGGHDFVKWCLSVNGVLVDVKGDLLNFIEIDDTTNIIVSILFSQDFVSRHRNRDNEIILIAMFSEKLELTISISDNAPQGHNKYELWEFAGSTWVNLGAFWESDELRTYGAEFEIRPVPSKFFDFVGFDGKNLDDADTGNLKFTLLEDRNITLNFMSKEFKIVVNNASSGAKGKLVYEEVDFKVGDTIVIAFDTSAGRRLKKMSIDGNDVTGFVDYGMVFKNDTLTITVTTEWLQKAFEEGWLDMASCTFTAEISADTPLSTFVIAGIITAIGIGVLVLLAIVFVIISVQKKKKDYALALAKHKEGMARLKQNIISDLVKD